MTFYFNKTGLLCSQILKTLFTRVAAQSWRMVVGAVVEIQGVPVVLRGKAHNLDLK